MKGDLCIFSPFNSFVQKFLNFQPLLGTSVGTGNSTLNLTDKASLLKEFNSSEGKTGINRRSDRC